MNRQFHIEEWKEAIRLSSLPDRRMYGAAVCGPRDIIVIEELRQRALLLGPLGRSVSTDVFVFAIGEPPARAWTKIGGAPYRPGSTAWPIGPGGVPMTFLAQYDFSDSRDIVPPLPGDILLVFVADVDFHPDVEGMFAFEWYPLGLDELIAPQAMPTQAWRFINAYGMRHRTVDYLEQGAADLCGKVVSAEAREGRQPLAVDAVRVLAGMKIGGVAWSQAVNCQSSNNDAFLCSLAEVVPEYGESFPWSNVSEPLAYDNCFCDDHVLYSWDGFILDFSLTADGDIRPHITLL